MQHKNMSPAELATALGVPAAQITAMTVAPPRHGMRATPAYEPSSYDLEVSIEVGQVGAQHIVFRRTRIWADHRQIHSSAVTAAFCETADEARQTADVMRIEGKLDPRQPRPRLRTRRRP